MITRERAIVIHQLMNKFEQGDMSLFELVDPQIDLAIGHYQDDLDVSWQQCKNLAGLQTVLQRLGQEVFPQGTKIINLHSTDLGSGWYLTHLKQAFFYAVRAQRVIGTSVIVSHEQDRRIDYFREIVQSVENV